MSINPLIARAMQTGNPLIKLLERLLGAWLAHRATPAESFFAFAGRHDIAALRALAERAPHTAGSSALLSAAAS